MTDKLATVTDIRDRIKTKKEPVDIVKEIVVRSTRGGPDRGTLRTEGMERFGQRNLRMRDVPLWLHPTVTVVMNQVAQHLINDGATVRDKTIMLPDGPFFPFMFKAETELGQDWWTLVDDHLVHECNNPNCPSHYPGPSGPRTA